MNLEVLFYINVAYKDKNQTIMLGLQWISLPQRLFSVLSLNDSNGAKFENRPTDPRFFTCIDDH